MSSATSPGFPVIAEHTRIMLDEGWQVAAATPGAPEGSDAPSDLDWLAARVPGTVASAMREAGRPDVDDDLDAHDWWFRLRFDAAAAEPGEEIVLCLGGIATVAEVHLNGACLTAGQSMFASQAIDVSQRLRGSNELVIRCLALTPELAVARRPRARWRTRLASDGNLRWFRTTLLGRAPGFAPGPAPVGPWRPIWLERRRGVVVDELRLLPRLEGDDGVLVVDARLRVVGESPIDRIVVELSGPSGAHRVELPIDSGAAGTRAHGEVHIPAVARWWPHTHGTPSLHDVRLSIVAGDATFTVEAGRVGFRTLAPGPRADHDLERDGLDLHVNGVRVFARGAVWTPVDPTGFGPAAEALDATLQRVRDAGMNLLRIPGFGVYETASFHDRCDELGILVWQDLAFANLDYPFSEDAFRHLAEQEVQSLLARLVGRPSFAVLCGNSEVEQQVAMLGLPASLWRDPFYGETVPALARAAGSDAIDVPSAPFGGDLPFRPDRGVANYFGVGGYRRPLSDARTAGVRFAAECLAFANVPDGAACAAIAPGVDPADLVLDPAWRAAVPRDVGSPWDFEDVRDHYLGLLYGLDPDELRQTDPERYLALSRSVSGEVMSEVYGEWRRAGSPCGGALVLWLRDVRPGAGWGVLDHLGQPKVAWHHLRRVLAPIAVWTTDEGLGGVVAHVANDGPEPLSARLRVGLYLDHELAVGGGETAIELAPHDATERDVEGIVGRFVDASWAYRFGPPAQDVIVASLERDEGAGVITLSQAFHYPAGRSVDPEPVERLGLHVTVEAEGADHVLLQIGTRRLAVGVRIDVPGFEPADDAFTIEPGRVRRIGLRRRGGGQFVGGALSALNLVGTLPIAA